MSPRFSAISGTSRPIPALVAGLPGGWARRRGRTHSRNSAGSPAPTGSALYCRMSEGDKAGLLEDWNQTRQLLLADARSRTVRTARNAVFALIALGQDDVVPELIRVLNLHNEQWLAEIYLNSDHQGLSQAARNWAGRHRCDISTHAGRSDGPAWGR